MGATSAPSDAGAHPRARLLNLGIDSKLRGCDLVVLKVRDVCHGDQMATQAIVMQHKTQRAVQFEITAATRDALHAWIKLAALKPDDFMLSGRLHESNPSGDSPFRAYSWALGGRPRAASHRRWDAFDAKNQGDTDLSPDQKNLRAVQLLLGHSNVESTVRHLGIEVDDALEISEQTEI